MNSADEEEDDNLLNELFDFECSLLNISTSVQRATSKRSKIQSGKYNIILSIKYNISLKLYSFRQ